MKPFRTLLVAATPVLASVTALAGELSVVPAAGHDPLYLDRATVRRAGPRVTFSYVLDVPAALDGAGRARRWRSNEVEATIDCAARTYSLLKFVTYAGPARTGNRTGGRTMTAQDRRPAPIVRTSTWDHLARVLCQ